MKQLLEKIYEAGLLIIVLLIVVHAPITVWLGTVSPDHEQLIKAWKELGMFLLAIIAIILVTRQKLWPKLIASPFIYLSLAFIAIHLLLVATLGGDASSLIAGLMIDLRFIAMFVLMFVLIALRPQALKRVINVVLAGAVIVIGFGLLQITVLPDDTLSAIGYSKETIAPFTTIDQNPDYVRINSTLRGPNPLGALMVVYGSIAIAYAIMRSRIGKEKQLYSLGLAVGSVAILFASYSRSAYIAAVVAIASIIAASNTLRKNTAVPLVLVGLILAVGTLFVSQTDWFYNVILHEDPESTVMEKSNDGHISSLREGVARVMNEPLGAGVGSTGSASLYDTSPTNDVIIENNYLFIAHESGWAGLAIFIALFGVIVVSLWRARINNWLAVAVLSCGIGLAIIGMLLPVWVDDTVSIIWWGLAGATVASISAIMNDDHAKRTRKQKTARTT